MIIIRSEPWCLLALHFLCPRNRDFGRLENMRSNFRTLGSHEFRLQRAQFVLRKFKSLLKVGIQIQPKGFIGKRICYTDPTNGKSSQLIGDDVCVSWPFEKGGWTRLQSISRLPTAAEGLRPSPVCTCAQCGGSNVAGKLKTTWTIVCAPLWSSLTQPPQVGQRCRHCPTVMSGSSLLRTELHCKVREGVARRPSFCVQTAIDSNALIPSDCVQEAGFARSA